jgi:hypothetical protein
VLLIGDITVVVVLVITVFVDVGCITRILLAVTSVNSESYNVVDTEEPSLRLMGSVRLIILSEVGLYGPLDIVLLPVFVLNTGFMAIRTGSAGPNAFFGRINEPGLLARWMLGSGRRL